MTCETRGPAPTLSTMPKGLFLTFHRESQPLSAHLDAEILGPALRRVQEMSADQFAASTDDLVAGLSNEVRVEPPRLREQERAAQIVGTRRPTRTREVSHATTRHHVAVQVDGHADLLNYWPDRDDPGLTPIDTLDAGSLRPGNGEPFDFAAEVRRYEARSAQERWFLAPLEAGGPVVLQTWIELTQDEEFEVLRKERDPAAQIDRQRIVIEPIVRAIAAQTLDFFAVDLPRALTAAIDGRRDQVAARRAVYDSLTWPPPHPQALQVPTQHVRRASQDVVGR